MAVQTESFPFRPWVRSTCRTAMIWGIGALAAVGAGAWLLRSPDEGAFGWAFTILSAYALLFLVTLLKIWWTAGNAAVEIDSSGIAYQPLHTFGPRRIPYERVLFCAPREGTESLCIVVEGLRRDREFFLNLGVVVRKHRLLEALGERLMAAGLEPIDAAGSGWSRPSEPSESTAVPKTR